MDKFSLGALAEHLSKDKYEDEDCACVDALWLGICALSRYPNATNKMLCQLAEINNIITHKAINNAIADADNGVD